MIVGAALKITAEEGLVWEEERGMKLCRCCSRYLIVLEGI